MYILTSKAGYNSAWVDYAGALLQEFVLGVETHYYKELLTYNMHSLKHIHDDVKVLGPVDKFSAFEFESFMNLLKKLMRSNKDHLTQVVTRVYEMDAVYARKDLRPEKATKVSSKLRDNCYLTIDSRICLVKNFNELEQECQVVYFKIGRAHV